MLMVREKHIVTEKKDNIFMENETKTEIILQQKQHEFQRK
jgi:hypothetical protein